jgi:uncharacterized membrane protein (DUF2068 family)
VFRDPYGRRVATEDTAGTAPPPETPAGEGGRRARLLPWIAAERAARGVVLLIIGAVVLARLHADWGGAVRWLWVHVGLNPTGRLVSRTIDRAHRLTVHQLVVIGVASIAYGVLELVEGVGLWKRRRWAEYLTIIATSLLVPLEIYELAHHATLLKVGGLIVNLAIVAYLVHVLRRREV